MPRNLNRIIFWLSVAIAVAGIVQQLRRPAGERDWHGKVLFVPYDFRFPSVQRARDAWWNPDDSRLLTPRDFGVGWSVNFARAYQLITGKQPGSPGED
jgi:hypothetical protein